MFLFGIFILASAIKIRDILTEELESLGFSVGHFGYNTCQYWAGIPVGSIDLKYIGNENFYCQVII